jgi:tetratricopeptide (TPR) repeat protein
MHRMLTVAVIALLTARVGFAQQAPQRIMVITDNAPLKTTNSTNGAVPRGVLLTAQEVKGDWLWVEYSTGKDSKKGWIHQRDVVPFDRAQAHVESEMARKPHAELYNIRGTIHYEKKDYERALADYNEALRLDPRRAHAWNNRGNVWRVKGDTARAISDFNQAIRVDPDYQLAYKNRGNVFSDKGALDKAIIDYSEAIRLNPNDADALTNRGVIRMLQGSYEQSTADLAEAIRVDPQFASAYNNLAWLLATCPEEKYRDGKRAVQMATRAAALGGWKNAGDIDTLATAYAEAGDFANAVKWQKKALEMAPAAKKPGYRSHLELYEAGKPYRDAVRR